MASFGFNWLRANHATELAAALPVATPPAAPATPDLGTQLEDMVVAIWREEQLWRVDDRINLAVILSLRRPT